MGIKTTVGRSADGDRHGFAAVGQLEGIWIDGGRIETERVEIAVGDAL